MYITIWYDLQECGNFTWRVSDCEELVGVTNRRKDVACWWRWRPPLVLILLKNFLSQRFLPPFLPPNDRLRHTEFKITGNRK